MTDRDGYTPEQEPAKIGFIANYKDGSAHHILAQILREKGIGVILGDAYTSSHEQMPFYTSVSILDPEQKALFGRISWDPDMTIIDIALTGETAFESNFLSLLEKSEMDPEAKLRIKALYFDRAADQIRSRRRTPSVISWSSPNSDTYLRNLVDAAGMTVLREMSLKRTNGVEFTLPATEDIRVYIGQIVDKHLSTADPVSE